MAERNAIILVLLTAFVSGFSIFLNKFAVAGTNPFVFTAMKNIVVAVFLLSALFLLKEFGALRRLSKRNWLQLATIGLVGGSTAFLIYFYALQLTSAINAGFLHKTIFVFATIFAIVFLKEKISRWFIAAAILLLAGNYLLFSKISAFTPADLLIVAAVFLWAIENILARQLLLQPKISGKTVAFGRMFFGSFFMLAFLLATNQFSFVFEQTAQQLQWLFITAILLFLYVVFYFSGLKGLQVHKATALLMLGQPVTVLLSVLFLNRALSFNDALGITLTVCGAVLVIGFSAFSNFSKAGKPNILKTR